MHTQVIEQEGNFVFYAIEGKVFYMEITEEMCSISLGYLERYAEGFQDYFGNLCMCQLHTWIYPAPAELSREEAAQVAEEHHSLSEPVCIEDLRQWAETVPVYSKFLNQ